MSPGFYVGQAVRTVNEHPAHHTRLPRYARGRRGHIEAVHGTAPLPAVAATGERRSPEGRFYTVRFDAAELWGHDAEEPSSVLLEVWEHQLEQGPAPTARSAR